MLKISSRKKISLKFLISVYCSKSSRIKSDKCSLKRCLPRQFMSTLAYMWSISLSLTPISIKDVKIRQTFKSKGKNTQCWRWICCIDCVSRTIYSKTMEKMIIKDIVKTLNVQKSPQKGLISAFPSWYPAFCITCLSLLLLMFIFCTPRFTNKSSHNSWII